MSPARAVIHNKVVRARASSIDKRQNLQTDLRKSNLDITSLTIFLMNRFKSFTGGVFDTNCFYYQAPEGGILFDAPQGAGSAFASEQVNLLCLPGHFDHVVDGAAIIKHHGFRPAFIRIPLPWLTTLNFFVNGDLSSKSNRSPPISFSMKGNPPNCSERPCASTIFRGTVLAACAFISSMKTSSSVATCSSAKGLVVGTYPEAIESCFSRVSPSFPLQDSITVLPGMGPHDHRLGAWEQSFSAPIKGICSTEKQSNYVFFLFSSPYNCSCHGIHTLPLMCGAGSLWGNRG